MPADRSGAGTGSEDIFNRDVEQYDAWYDSPSGARLFASELDAVRPLLDELPHPWLEVGVGTGRFASALGVEYGIDPAGRALELASRRGVDVQIGLAEQLPYPDGRFGAVLFIVTLCFVEDPQAALSEARRVLQPDGALVLGLLPAEGGWARLYQAMAAKGDPYYRLSRFFSREEVEMLLDAAGFQVERVRTTLFQLPGGDPRDEPAREGGDPDAGFLAIRATPV